MSWSHPGYEAVAGLLGERTGLRFSPQRHDSAEMGMSRAMRRAGLSDLVRYRDLLATDRDALDDLIVEVTIGETYFFREPAQFDLLRRLVLPELQRRRGYEHVPRVWSAGCASGEEAYSLAILFEQEGWSDRVHLLATDISRTSLARAQRADYGAWSLRGEGAANARPYLVSRGDHYRLSDNIRARVTFQYLNLALDSYPSWATGTWGMDLILCRNVLIYLDAATISGVARRLLEALAPGGWLFTASSDPPLGANAPFDLVVTDAGVFYRRRLDGSPDGAAFRLPEAPPVQETLARLAPWLPPRTSNILPVPNAPSRPREQRPLKVEIHNDPLAEAHAAYARGDYASAVALTREAGSAAACALHVRALANLDPATAERACAEAVARHTLSAELAYLHTVLLLDLGRLEEAARLGQRTLYLDRSLAVVHFTLGSIQARRGDRAGSRRAYRNAQALCAARPADEVVPLSDGEHAGRLAEAAAAQLAIFDSAAKVTA